MSSAVPCPSRTLTCRKHLAESGPIVRVGFPGARQLAERFSRGRLSQFLSVSAREASLDTLLFLMTLQPVEWLKDKLYLPTEAKGTADIFSVPSVDWFSLYMMALLPTGIQECS